MTGAPPLGSALVVGDGPAGLLAAAVLRQAGWPVTLLTGQRSAHHGHIHSIGAAALQLIADLVGDGSIDQSVHSAWQVNASGLVPLQPRPVVDAANLTNWMRAKLQAFAGPHLCFIACREAAGMAQHTLAWLAEPRRTPADLCIDATGSSRLVLKALEPTLDLLEAGACGFYHSWQGTAAIPHPPVTVIDRFGNDAVLLTVYGNSVRLTWQSDGGVKAADRDDWLIQTARGAPASLAASLQTIRFAPRPQAYRAPAGRRTALEDVETDKGAVLIALGDCLLQTAPRLGQGFAQLAGQVALLKQTAAAAQPDWRMLRDALADSAAATFLLAAMVDGPHARVA
jgi:hypothetical protein